MKLSILLSLLGLCLSLSFQGQAIEVEQFNEKLYQQVLANAPDLADSYYYEIIPHEDYLNFLQIYEKRPIQVNEGGMRSHGNFFMWYLLRKINPTLVIESGVFRGQSTWMIEQASESAKIIAIDIDLNQRWYRSNRATYTNQDFSGLKIDDNNNEIIVAFFDDHINAYNRVLESHKKGIKHLIFDDNYPPGFDDCYPWGGHLTLQDCFAMEEHKEKAATLKSIIKHYYIMPQIVGNTAGFFPIGKIIENLPSIWPKLEDVDPEIRDQMQIFYQDAPRYRWLTYVELY